MAGGGSFISDQKFTTLTADGNFKTITGGSVNLGPCRVTYIQAHAATNGVVKLHDGTGTGGSLELIDGGSKVILQTGDSVEAYASAASSVDIITSVVDTISA